MSDPSAKTGDCRKSSHLRPTSFFARIGPMPLTNPLPRCRSIPSAVVGGTVFMVIALNTGKS